jgi:hypothetical protein
MKHRNVEYSVREVEPRLWRWYVVPIWASKFVISSPKFQSREAAVEACMEEINNAIERSRSVPRGL